MCCWATKFSNLLAHMGDQVFLFNRNYWYRGHDTIYNTIILHKVKKVPFDLPFFVF